MRIFAVFCIAICALAQEPAKPLVETNAPNTYVVAWRWLLQKCYAYPGQTTSACHSTPYKGGVRRKEQLGCENPTFMRVISRNDDSSPVHQSSFWTELTTPMAYVDVDVSCDGKAFFHAFGERCHAWGSIN